MNGNSTIKIIQLEFPQDTLRNEEVLAAARTLAKFNLGICFVHMHNPDTGATVPLPSGMVSYEKALSVSFANSAHLEETAVPVAWRWTGEGLEVCASCCSGPSGPTD